MHRTLTFAFVFLMACAGSVARRPESIARPSIQPELVNQLFFGSGTTAPATIEVRVRNNATVPIVLRRIEVDSPGMGQFQILRTNRTFRETIAPGETKPFAIFAMAETTRRNPTEPLTLRAIVDFESGKVAWREMVMTR